VGGAPRITVITPTYDRAHTLGRLRESLVRQTFGDFEWLVVDDGSRDRTGELVRSWVAEGGLDVRYRHQTNRGKHVALNRGFENARGELVTVVDSDDWLVPNALERYLHHWDSLSPSERDRFWGVVGLAAFEDGTVVGDVFPVEPLDCDDVELRYVLKVRGDKHGLHRTDVCRSYSYPFEDTRGWVAEALVLNRIALRFRARHVNEVMLIKQYQAEGITDRALELLVRAAPATYQYRLEETRLPHRLSAATRFRAYANSVRFGLHAGKGLLEQARAVPSPIVWATAAPAGLALYLRDRRSLSDKAFRVR
jgi:glycosyltransferase involved in cell wall biosynthesis